MKYVKLFIMGVVANLGLAKMVFDCRGEVAPEPEPKPEPKFTQEDVDRVVQERLKREQSKYSNYDELKKFKDEYEKSQEQLTQKQLEEQKKYEELKKGWESKEQNYNNALAEKENALKSLKIDHSLNSTIAELNAYPETAMIVKPLIVLGEDGMPKMKGKDSVGNEQLVDLKIGLEGYLKDKPHLVKAGTPGGGSGTTPAGEGAGQGQGESLDALNKQLMEASTKNDFKKVQELKVKINAYFTANGINRNI